MAQQETAMLVLKITFGLCAWILASAYVYSRTTRKYDMEILAAFFIIPLLIGYATSVAVKWVVKQFPPSSSKSRTKP
jgi:hypothetical protein